MLFFSEDQGGASDGGSGAGTAQGFDGSSDGNSASGNGAAQDEPVTKLAHRFWEEEGRPEGRADDHWRRAEEEVLQRQACESPVASDLSAEAQRTPDGENL